MNIPGLETDQVAFVDRLNFISDAITNGKLVDSSLAITSKNSFSFFLRRVVCPLYWCLGKDIFAMYRIVAVSNALLLYCKVNESYVTHDILQTKVISIISTLDQKTKLKYEKELMARDSLKEWAGQLTKIEKPVTKNILGAIIDEVKGEVLHVAADALAGNEEGGKAHLHLDDTGGFTAYVKSLAKGILHIVIKEVFETVLHGISPAAHAVHGPLIRNVFAITKHAHKPQ